MEESLNGDSTEEICQKPEVDVVKLDDESQRVSSVVAEESFEVAVGENGKDSSSSSSSSDEETEVVVAEKIDEIIASMVKCGNEENGVESDLVVQEEAGEIKSVEVAEEEEEKITVEEAVDEVSPDGEAGGSVEAEGEVVVAEEEAQTADHVVAVGLNDAVEEKAAAAEEEEPDLVETVDKVLTTAVEAREVEVADQEAAEGSLKQEDESSPSPAVAKSSNGAADGYNKAEIPEPNGNPHIISISTRTMQRTSWIGCCGLLEVFRRGG